MGRVFVAGSINMDVVATAERHPKIGETVAGKDVLYFPGGKGANQAVAAAKQGVLTTLIGGLGDDAFGKELRSFLAAQSIDLGLVKDVFGVHTGTAVITLANADNTIVVVPGANGTVDAVEVSAAPLAKGDVAVSQFEIPLPAIRAFFEKARSVEALTVLNPAPALKFDGELLDLVDVLVVNESELGVLTGNEFGEDGDLKRFISAALSLGGREKIVCVTLGARGVLALIDGAPLMIPGRPVKAVDTTGAGDCFVGALAAQLARGATVPYALNYANAAAAICVQRMGAAPSMPTAAEVDAVLSASRPSDPSSPKASPG
jgi:ribokinase